MCSYTYDSLAWPPLESTPYWVVGLVYENKPCLPRTSVCFERTASICRCYGWHSQGEFFTLLPMSVNNNVLLAGERFVAIAFPFRAKQFGRTRYRLIILFCVLSLLYNLTVL